MPWSAVATGEPWHDWQWPRIMVTYRQAAGTWSTNHAMGPITGSTHGGVTISPLPGRRQQPLGQVDPGRAGPGRARPTTRTPGQSGAPRERTPAATTGPCSGAGRPVQRSRPAAPHGPRSEACAAPDCSLRAYPSLPLPASARHEGSAHRSESISESVIRVDYPSRLSESPGRLSESRLRSA